eukprot:343535-Hanusia_phi.AAC.1
MKPFHWSKLPLHECEQSVWRRSKEMFRASASAAIDAERLQTLFCIKKRHRSLHRSNKTGTDSETSEVGKNGHGEGKKSRQRYSLLDLRRAQNIGIMLSKFRCSLRKIREAVVELDASVLTLDDVASLKQYVPTDEEIEMLRAFQGDARDLGIAERFFLEILSVPRYRERLSVFEFVKSFEDRWQEATSGISTLRHALLELRDCKGLHQVLENLLAIGNFMNYGTSMGNAGGFRLDALEQVTNMRSNMDQDGAVCSLLDYLVAQLSSSGQEKILSFTAELKHLEASTKVSLPLVLEHVAHLRQGLSSLEHEISLAAPDDPLAARLPEFVAAAKEKLEALVADVEAVNALFSETRKLYGENSKVSQMQLCRKFASFCSAFLAAVQAWELKRVDTSAPCSPHCSRSAKSSDEVAAAPVCATSDVEVENTEIVEEEEEEEVSLDSSWFGSVLKRGKRIPNRTARKGDFPACNSLFLYSCLLPPASHLTSVKQQQATAEPQKTRSKIWMPRCCCWCDDCLPCFRRLFSPPPPTTTTSSSLIPFLVSGAVSVRTNTAEAPIAAMLTTRYACPCPSKPLTLFAPSGLGAQRSIRRVQGGTLLRAASETGEDEESAA